MPKGPTATNAPTSPAISRDGTFLMTPAQHRETAVRLAGARRPDDEDLGEASREADKTPEPASIDPGRSLSAAEAAAREADALLADLLPRLTDEERALFQDALTKLDQ